MKGLVKSFVFAAAVLVGSSNALAAGTIKLTISDSSGTKVLSVTDVGGGEFDGTLTTNGGAPETVVGFFDNTSMQIDIGAEQASLSISRSSTDILYNGRMSSTRPTDIDVDIKNGRLKYGGDYIGAYTNFAGKADADSLFLFWGQNYLRLDPDPAVAGGCKGEVRKGSAVTTLKCETTGDHTNIFFKNSDHVIAWIVNLLVK